MLLWRSAIFKTAKSAKKSFLNFTLNLCMPQSAKEIKRRGELTIHKASSSRWTKRLINNKKKYLNRPADGNYCIQALITPRSLFRRDKRKNIPQSVHGNWWTPRLMSRALHHCFIYELHKAVRCSVKCVSMLLDIRFRAIKCLCSIFN